MRCHAWLLVKTLFSQKLFATSIGDLKLKFEYHQQLKKWRSRKVFCLVQVHTL